MGGSIAWSPSSLGTNLVQRFLDANPTYYASTLQSYPILTPEETGTVAVPRGQRCALFDGSNDYATLGARLTAGSSANLYAAAWIKTSGNTIAIMGEYDSNSANCSWYMRVSATGKLQVFLSTDGGTTNFKDYSSATSVNTGSWVHVAFTFIAGILTLYVNGVAETATKTTDGTVASLFSTTAPFAIGAVNIASSITSFFSGSMYGARVGIVAKSPTEIAAIYNQASTPSTIDTTGLLGMWPLQEEGVVNGGLHYDVSGNGRHLTANNITASTYNAVDSGVKYSYPNAKGYSKALQFDGVNNSADGGRITSGIVSAMTLCFSINPSSVASQYSIVHECDAPASSGWYVGNVTADKTKLQWYFGSGAVTCDTPTGTLAANTLLHVVFVYDGTAVGNASRLKCYLNGVQATLAFTGTVPASMPDHNNQLMLGRYTSGGFYFPGKLNRVRIYNVAKSAGEAVAIYSGTNDTTGLLAHYNDQYDESGNGRNLTLRDGASVFVIPASLTDQTKDAAGNALGVTGPVAHPVTCEVPCVTGDGSAVRVELGSALIPATADFTLSFWHYHVAGSGNVQATFYQGDGAGAGVVQPYVDYNGTSVVANKWGLWLDTSNAISASQDLTPNAWHYIELTRASSLWTLKLNGVSVGTATRNFSVGQTSSSLLAAFFSASWNQPCFGRLSDFRMTTGGVTKYFWLAEGASRHVYWIASDGTSGKVSNAIVNGTVATIRGQRCPYAQDPCILYGGGIGADSEFVLGRIGSNLDAAGNTKTLSAGKHGNPYSRICPNTWSAPELVNIGYTSSTKLAPSDTVQATSPADTKFRRNKTDGSDRYFATLAALTGSDKTNAESYVG